MLLSCILRYSRSESRLRWLQDRLCGHGRSRCSSRLKNQHSGGGRWFERQACYVLNIGRGSEREPSARYQIGCFQGEGGKERNAFIGCDRLIGKPVPVPLLPTCSRTGLFHVSTPHPLLFRQYLFVVPLCHNLDTLLQTTELWVLGTRHGLIYQPSCRLFAPPHFCRYRLVSDGTTTLTVLPYRYPATFEYGHNDVGLFTQRVIHCIHNCGLLRMDPCF